MGLGSVNSILGIKYSIKEQTPKYISYINFFMEIIQVHFLGWHTPEDKDKSIGIVDNYFMLHDYSSHKKSLKNDAFIQVIL